MTTSPHSGLPIALAPATLVRRFVAWLVDAAIALVVGIITYGALTYFEIGSVVRAGSSGLFATLRFAIDVSFEAFNTYWWIFAIAFILMTTTGAILSVMGSGSGQTPGRRVLGIYVTDSRGEPLSAGRALGRAALFNVFLYLPIIGWALTIVSIALDPARRAFYDRVTSTHVVGNLADGGGESSYRNDPAQRMQALTAQALSPTASPAEPDQRDTAISPLVRSLDVPPRTVDGDPAPLPSWLQSPGVPAVPPPPGPIAGATDQVPEPPSVEPQLEPESPAVGVSSAPGVADPKTADSGVDSRRESVAELSDDVEMTRLVAPGQATQEHRPGSSQPVRGRVQVSDGQTVDIRGTTLVGRNPTPRPGERAVTLLNVQDPGRSVSKTHLALGLDEHGMWVADRGSTNGSLVTLPDGQRIVCFPEQPIRLSPGTSVHLGKITITVLPM